MKKEDLKFRQGERVHAHLGYKEFDGEVLSPGVEDPVKNVMVRSATGLTHEVARTNLTRLPG